MKIGGLCLFSGIDNRLSKFILLNFSRILSLFFCSHSFQYQNNMINFAQCLQIYRANSFVIAYFPKYWIYLTVAKFLMENSILIKPRWCSGYHAGLSQAIRKSFKACRKPATRVQISAGALF